MEVSGQRHAPAALYHRETTPDIHWVGGWVDLRANLDIKARGKILCLCRCHYIYIFFKQSHV
jgi:hypothetical protein